MFALGQFVLQQICENAFLATICWDQIVENLAVRKMELNQWWFYQHPAAANKVTKKSMVKRKCVDTENEESDLELEEENEEEFDSADENDEISM